jgi:hypothetical protein
MTLTVSRGTNLVEYYESTPLTAVNDALEVHVDSSEFTFAAVVSGGANFTLIFEANYNGGGTWFELDTSKTRSGCASPPSALAHLVLFRLLLLHITANDRNSQRRLYPHRD